MEIATRRCGVLVLAAALSAGAARAGQGLDPAFTAADLEALTGAVGDALAFPNLGTASPGGLPGFQLLGAAGGPEIDTGARWWSYVPHANEIGGFLVGQRVIARKGLPLNFDVGVQAGKVLGGDLWGADVRWAFVESGVLQPAAALRVAYSRLDTSLLDRCEVGEVQIVLSKGFVVLSPYGALGYRRAHATATFGAPQPSGHTADVSGATAVVGAKLTLLPFLHVFGEVRWTTRTAVFVGLGVGQ